MAIILGLISALCLFLIMVFVKGYRHGMAVAFVRLCSHIPYLKKYAARIADKHKDKLETIDKQVALLHSQRKSSFYGALSLEFLARIVSCVEVWLILNVLTTDVSFLGCILIVAFSSLLATFSFYAHAIGRTRRWLCVSRRRFVSFGCLWRLYCAYNTGS